MLGYRITTVEFRACRRWPVSLNSQLVGSYERDSASMPWAGFGRSNRPAPTKPLADSKKIA